MIEAGANEVSDEVMYDAIMQAHEECRGIVKFINEYEIANKINNRTLIIPGKVAVLKGEIQDKLPDWNVVVGPAEAVGLVKFMKDLQA